jgi:superfamily I DNA/RNA helicase
VAAETSDEEAFEDARERLLAIEAVTESVITEVRTAPSATAGLWNWFSETQLKHRIGTQWEEIAARDQFHRLREVIELAEFLEKMPEFENTWERYLTALERAFKYSSTRLEAIETDRSDGGVAVKTIYSLKHSSSKAVFLPNVTDDAYPFTPDLTPLLPMSRLREEAAFPTLTTPSKSEIEATFRPTVETSGDGFTQYFTEVSRRLLGTAAYAATDRLYFALPREGADSLGTYHQPSRFLTELIEEFVEIAPLAQDEKRGGASHGGASEFVVEHVDETLEAVRRAAVGGDSVDLDSYERELAAIERLLEQPEAATVRDAIEARVDFRHGRVRRE